VVNLALRGVAEPTVTLLIFPVVVGFIVTTLAPVGLILILALFPLNVTLLVAVNVVNVAGAGVVAPRATLLILPVTVGLIVTVPVPVGLIVMLALTGLKFTVDNAVNPLNVPAAGVVAPTTTLLIDPVIAGLAANELVTDKSEIVPLVLKITFFVIGSVVIVIPPAGCNVSVLLVELRLTVGCPATAI
jgi:hypothetical protein